MWEACARVEGYRVVGKDYAAAKYDYVRGIIMSKDLIVNENFVLVVKTRN